MKREAENVCIPRGDEIYIVCIWLEINRKLVLKEMGGESCIDSLEVFHSSWQWSGMCLTQGGSVPAQESDSIYSYGVW